MKIFYFFLTLVCLQSAVYSQSHSPSATRDSIAIWELRSIYHSLNLDSNQAVQFLAAVKSKLSLSDSLRTGSTTADDRTVKIREINKRFSVELKTIFSAIQYNQYVSLQQKQRQLFNQRLSGKKIKVKEIKEDD